MVHKNNSNKTPQPYSDNDVFIYFLSLSLLNAVIEKQHSEGVSETWFSVRVLCTAHVYVHYKLGV